MKPEKPLSDEQMARHNDLYNRAYALLQGLVMLDGKPWKPPGFFGKRKLREAVKLFEKALEINPTNWQAMFGIGKAFQSLEELELALNWVMRARDCVPENPSVAKEVGHMAGRLGRHDIAVRVLEVIIEKNPQDAALHTNLGLSCLMSGKVTEACKAFERTVELEPQRELNHRLLALAKRVESGECPCPGSERDISKVI